MSKKEATINYLAHPRPFLAWTILILSILFNGYAFALQITTARLVNSLADSFHITLPQATYILGLYLYAFFLMRIPAGILIDRYGTRKIPTLAILLCGGGAVLLSQSESLVTLGLARVMMGVGGSFAFLNGLKLISNWFYAKRFAYIMGIFVGLSVLSFMFMEIFILRLEATIGWREAILALGLGGFILGCAFFFVVQDAPGAGFSIHTNQQEGTLRFFLKKVFHNPQNWIIGIATGFVIGPLLAFEGLWSRLFLETTYGLSEMSARIINAFFIVGYAIGSPFFGRISSSLEKRKVFIPWGSGIAILMLLIIIYPPYLGASLTAVCYFILGFSASTINLGYVTVHEINVPRVAATGLGIANTFYAAFSAMIHVLIVVFLQLALSTSHETAYTPKDFQLSLLRIPIYLIIGFVFTLFIKETHAKQRYSYEAP